MSLFGAVNIFDTIASGFSKAASALGLQYLAAILIGIVLLGFLYILIARYRSYESKLIKSIDGFNLYFSKKPYIGEDNLIEFNTKMKKAPRILRNRWQVFILNREDGPGKYINIDSCVEKPLRTSTMERDISNFMILSTVLAIVGLMFSLSLMETISLTADMLFRSMIIPTIIMVLSGIFMFIMKGLKNAVQSDLFEYFHIFEQNINRAVTNLPAYIDYEILFTKKEIRDSIPILQQYLEKRALIEQQELEKARMNAIEVESFNFEDLGINGSLVLERAMRECEVYLGTRRRLQMECDNLETEKENYAKNYEITSKDYQRKLQVSRENLESLKKQQEASTNRIESNYIKKQQGDEIKKQQQIEKDADAATAKFKEEQEILAEEIRKRKVEIEERRKQVEDVMRLEFKNYARLMYTKLTEAAQVKVDEKLTSLEHENNDLRSAIKNVQTDDVSVRSYADNIAKREEEERERQELLQGANKDDAPKFVFDNFDLEAEKKAWGSDETKTPAASTAHNISDKPKAAPEPSPKFESEPKPEFKPEPAPAPAAEPFRPMMKGPSAPPDFHDSSAVSKGVATEDELIKLQQKIDEENARLFKQKQEFSDDINGALSRIDKPAPAPAPVVSEAPVASSADDDIQAMLDAMATSKPAKAPAKTRAAKAPKETTTTKTVNSDGTVTKTTVTKAAKTKPSAAVSDIDDINSEMEKLLSSLNDGDDETGGQ